MATTTEPAPMKTSANVPRNSATTCSPMVFMHAPSLQVPAGPNAPLARMAEMNRAEAYPRYNSSCMKALLVSSDPQIRQMMALAARSVRRSLQEPIETLEASNGVRGMALAWRDLPDVVIADEISSRAGGFALAKE